MSTEYVPIGYNVNAAPGMLRLGRLNMEFHEGQQVWAHFLGEKVKATVAEVGYGEVKVVEHGAAKGEWIPLSWCYPLDDDYEDDDDY